LLRRLSISCRSRILLRRLNISYGVISTAIQWFRSYLTGRSHYVRRGSFKSSIVRLVCGVPQRSVFGPVLFVLYTADLIHLIKRHSLHPHLYADDTQVYGSCSPADVRQLQSRVSSCVDDIASWMQSNRLKLNTDKTEVLWYATSRRQHQLPTTPTRIGNDLIMSSTSVRDLGVYLDADRSIRSHVNILSKCFAVLRQLCSIRQSVLASAYQTLIVSLVLTKLDYENAVLSGLPAHSLQSVMNAAARSIAGLCRSEHITTTLAGLHWLRASERIDFKLATLTYRYLHGMALRPVICRATYVVWLTSRRGVGCGLRPPMHWTFHQPGCRPVMVTECSLWLPLVSGTIFLPLSHLRRLFLSSVGF
jgi:hypothetical protein